MAAGTIEKICSKLSMTIKIDDIKSRPVSLSDAADLIVVHKDYVAKTWDAERRELFGFGDRTSGKKMGDSGLVASVLVGYLGKNAKDL